MRKTTLIIERPIWLLCSLRTGISGPRPVPWWIILVSVLVGLLILLIVVLILWRYGFFKRKKYEPSLYRAELQHEREQWSQTQM